MLYEVITIGFGDKPLVAYIGDVVPDELLAKNLPFRGQHQRVVCHHSAGIRVRGKALRMEYRPGVAEHGQPHYIGKILIV